MKPTDLQARLRGIAWPAPSPELRARVLAAESLIGPSIAWSDRLWFSRAFRVSLVAVGMGLLTLDQLSGTREAAALMPSPSAVAQVQAIEDTARQLELPAEATAALARRALAESRARPAVQRFDPLTDWPTDAGDSR
jgi:hypothetical protein